jgi:hypothetical protein
LKSIKNSNAKRNDLPQRAGVSEKVVKMFRKLVESAELHTYDAVGLFEDTSNDFLRDTLWRILDIVRFNDCNWRFSGRGPLPPGAMDQESAGDYYARVKVPFLDNRAGNFDGIVLLSFKDELKRETGVSVYVGVEQDEASNDVQFPQDWKGVFPPNIMPNFSKLEIFFDVVDITTASNEELSTKRIAQLIVTDACTFYDWISIYASRVECFRRSMEAIKEELNRLNSDSPRSLVRRANGLLKYVAAI